MGGKGRRRREKNYKAAHGGSHRLPPPPDLSKLDALPSKLRKLMAFTSPSTPQPSQGSAKASTDNGKKGKRGDAAEKKLHPKDELNNKTTKIDTKGDGEHSMTPQDMEDGEGTLPSSTHEKGKRKRKRKQVKDLRFEAEMDKLAGLGSKRRERKKKYFESRKNKHKRAKTEENLEFPRHEMIKFGEVVEAPPKLSAIPKVLKTVQGASQERIRLQAVEAYRKRKGWVSRPGVHLPPPVTTTPI